MDELPQDAWFYTCEGERHGPVTFAELRAKAQASALNPRQDMVWTQGLAEWQAAGEIAGLFEKRTAEQRESMAPLAAAYVPPPEESAAIWMNRLGNDWPGARRRSFIIATLVFLVVWHWGFAAGGGFLTAQFGPQIMRLISPGAALLPLVVVVYFGFRRLMNLGMSCWWYLANFVPILNIWLGYRCFACPAGYAYHKKLDGVGVLLAIIYWLLVVLGIIAVVVMAALFCGVLGTPALQDQLREAWRMMSEQTLRR